MASIAPPANEEVEQVSYKARDWRTIGKDIGTTGSDTRIPSTMRGFGKYIEKKAETLTNIKGGDYVFGETLTSEDAAVVRQAARGYDCEEVKGGSSS